MASVVTPWSRVPRFSARAAARSTTAPPSRDMLIVSFSVGEDVDRARFAPPFVRAADRAAAAVGSWAKQKRPPFIAGIRRRPRGPVTSHAMVTNVTSLHSVRAEGEHAPTRRSSPRTRRKRHRDVPSEARRSLQLTSLVTAEALPETRRPPAHPIALCARPLQPSVATCRRRGVSIFSPRWSPAAACWCLGCRLFRPALAIGSVTWHPATADSDERPPAGHRRDRLPGVGERVLLLGAGASFGARVGLRGWPNGDDAPPLGSALATYLVDWFKRNSPDTRADSCPVHHDIDDPLCTYCAGDQLWTEEGIGDVIGALADVASNEPAKPDEPTPFEGLMQSWSDAEHQLFGPTHRLLAYSMNFGNPRAFVECGDRLDHLIARVEPTIIVTVNYDTLTEEALRRRGFRCSHPGLRDSGGGDHDVSPGVGEIVPVFKLHGSVNWMQVPSRSGSATYKEAQSTGRDRPTSPTQSGPLPGVQTWLTSATFDRPSLKVDLENGENPVIAVYGSGKHVIANSQHIDEHRATCLRRLAESSIDRVVTVGIRPVTAKDDPILDEVIDLLADKNAAKLYVSPDEGQCGEFRLRGFTPIQKTLADFLPK
jgi:hypothetical protein